MNVPKPDFTNARRANTLSLFQEYLEQQIAAGAQPKGLEQLFAARLEVSPSTWSQIKSGRPIGTKLARQIETHCEKPVGWLDETRESNLVTPGEQQMMALTLKAWRATNSVGRKNLKLLLRSIAEGKTSPESIR